MNEALTTTMQGNNEERLAAVEAKLDQISGQLQLLIDAQRPFAELAQEMGPIASEMMSTGIDQFAHLEERGYFAFARELKYFIDRLVEDYDPSDLHELADNAANILDTVRAITRPSVMAAVRDAVDAFDDSRKLAPVGVFGAYRKIRKDKNIQRGIAFALDVVGRVGRAVARAPRLSRSELRALPSPVHAQPVKRSVTNTMTESTYSADGDASTPQLGAKSERLDFDPSVFVPESEWSRELGQTRATSLGLVELTNEHWEVVECVRVEYINGGSTPNIRKITHISGVDTRTIYRLFPKAPGLTIACIACVPRPVGCL